MARQVLWELQDAENLPTLYVSCPEADRLLGCRKHQGPILCLPAGQAVELNHFGSMLRAGQWAYNQLALFRNDKMQDPLLHLLQHLVASLGAVVGSVKTLDLDPKSS